MGEPAGKRYPLRGSASGLTLARSSEPRCYDRRVILPPTRPSIGDDATRPYFLWWTDATSGDLRARLRSPDLDERGYWLGALLREANSRDVWVFTTPSEIREVWRFVVPHLGRQREMWAWLLGLPSPEWPPKAQP
jgi:hypothetical protein